MDLQRGDIGVERSDDRPACGSQSVAEILNDRVVLRTLGVELHIALQLGIVALYLGVDRRAVDRERSGNQFIGFGRVQQVFFEEFRHSDLVFQREAVGFILGVFGNRLLGFRYDIVYFVVFLNFSMLRSTSLSSSEMISNRLSINCPVLSAIPRLSSIASFS